MAEVSNRQGLWRNWAKKAGLWVGVVFILGIGPVVWTAGWRGVAAWAWALTVCWVAGVLSLLPAAWAANGGAETLLQAGLLITGFRPVLTLAAGVGWFFVVRPMIGVYAAGLAAGYLVLLAWETRSVILLARELITEKHRRELAAKKVNTCGSV